MKLSQLNFRSDNNKAMSSSSWHHPGFEPGSLTAINGQVWVDRSNHWANTPFDFRIERRMVLARPHLHRKFLELTFHNQGKFHILDWENIAVPNRFYIEWGIMICRNFSLKMLFLNLILKLFLIFFVLIKQNNNKSKYFIATKIIYYGEKF